MSSRKAHALDINTYGVGWVLLLGCLTFADVAAETLSPPEPLSLNASAPAVVATGQVIHVPESGLWGSDHILNQGVIWGNGTLGGSVDNRGLLITDETRPSELPGSFDQSPRSTQLIPSVSKLPWLQYGRVNATSTMNISGDFLERSSGSTYFTVTPTGNSQLQVAGEKLQLDGELEIHLENFDSHHKGPLRPTFTLINPTNPSAQLISGTPQVLIADDSGKWSYRVTETSSGQVFLTLDPVKYFEREAGTLNQRLLGKLLDHEVPTATGALYNTLNTLYQLPQAQYQNTLTRIDGELHAETPGILYSAVADAWNPVYARMGMSASQGGYVPEGDPHYWISGLGSFGGVEGNLNATGYHQQSAGSLIGTDTKILDLMTVGLTAGYLSAGATRTGIDNQLKANLWQIGTYADMPLGETGHFGLLIGYDQGGTSTQNASLLGLSKSSGEARLITAEALTSWRYDLGGGHSLTPIFAFQSLTTQHSGLVESGLAALDSIAGSFSSNFVSARIQTRYDYQWQAFDVNWISSLAVGFREMLNQPLADREIGFVGTSGGYVLTRGAQSNGQTGAGLINAGLTGHLNNQFDLELGYRGIYSGTARLSSFQGNVVWNYDAPDIKAPREPPSRLPAIENPKAVEDDKKPLTIRDPGADMANYPNSAFTLPEGGFYLESTPFSYTARSGSSGPPTETGQVLLRYGLVENIELRLFYTPYEVQNKRAGSVSGSGPMAFDTKIHLWDAWEEYFIPAAGFELTITTPWLASTAFQSPTSPGFSFNFDQDLPYDIGIEYNIGATNFEDPHDLSKSVWQLAAQWAAQRDITDDVAVFFNGYYNRTTLPRVSHHHTETRLETRYHIICTETGALIGHTTCQQIAHIVSVPYQVLVPLDPISEVPVVLGAGLIWTLNDHVQLFGNTAAGVTQGSPGLQTYVGFAWTP